MTIEKSNEEIINHLRNGKTLKEIAGVVYLSVETVKKRLKKMREKYKCKSTIQLVDKLKEEKVH